MPAPTAGSSSRAPARRRSRGFGGTETIIGGRGFTLGDDGSGSHIGLDAMRAAMRAYDGLGPASALTRDLVGHFGGDPVAMMRWARDAKPGDFGAFAPRVFERAAACDPVALSIVGAAARAVGVLARGVVALGAERVALVGGVGEALRPYLDPDIAARLSRRSTIRRTARSCSRAAPWRRKGKPRNEGFLRRAACSTANGCTTIAR